MANILFTGNLTEDAKPLNDGMSIFTVAENKGTKEKPHTNYIDCKGHFSEEQLNILKKGKEVSIVGDLNFYTSEKDNVKYKNHSVYIFNLTFGRSPKAKEEEQPEA